MVAEVTKSPRKYALTREQYEQAKDRYLHGESAETIALDFNCKRHVLDTRFSRDGLPARRLARLKDGRGERTKEKIALCTETIVDALSDKTPKSLESLNLHTDTLLKAAKIGQVVHGWGEGVNVAVVVAGLHTSRADDQEQQPAIDIESSSDQA